MITLKAIALALSSKLIPGLIAGGKLLARKSTTLLNKVVPKISSGVVKLGSKAATLTKNPKMAANILTASQILANKKLIRAVTKDVAYKAVKEGITRIPLIGKVAKPILDVGDYVIGIPFI